MTLTERHIIDTYSKLFDGLNALTKIELIEVLTKSLKKRLNQEKVSFINHLEPLRLINLLKN